MRNRMVLPTPLLTAGALVVLSLASGLFAKERTKFGRSAIAGSISYISPTLDARTGKPMNIAGAQFRDLNRNGTLEPYEDWRLPDAVRARDLVSRMTLEEKAGAMVHGTLAAVDHPLGLSTKGYDVAAMEPEITQRHITSMITRLAVTPAKMAEENNRIQEIAARGRLGIPMTISTDPRHHFQVVSGATTAGMGYSQWPESLGFGALGELKLMKRFGQVAGQEYRATGIHQALSPQADLFTEPRWPRGTATFGSNPAKARDLVQAYVEGFQGGANGLTRNGVLTVVKHWVAYGATPEGWDGHNYYGRYSRANNASFASHVEAFKGAFKVQVAGVMPTYSIVQGVSVNGKPLEQVAAGYNKQILTDLLRKTHGFKGIVLSDWGITSDCSTNCRDARTPHNPMVDIGMPWGVESLSKLERFAKGINAGIDQFGGTSESQYVVEAVKKGLVAEAQVNAAVTRIMIPKFRMGLFENPYVDPAAVSAKVSTAAILAEAAEAQRAAQVLIKNDGIFPLKPGTKVWLEGISKEAAIASGLTIADTPEAADIALVRLSTPFEKPHANYFFGRMQNEGRLDFRPGEAGHDLVKSLRAKTKVAVALFADRPAVLGDVNSMASAILVNFGVSDAALLDVMTGKAKAKGRLPFELPSNMAAVEAQDPAKADDSRAPLYRAGFGILK